MRSPSKNMCSVRHSPIPSAPNPPARFAPPARGPRRPAPGGEPRRRGPGPEEILGGGSWPDEDDFAALMGQRLRLVRVEYRLARRRPGRGRETLRDQGDRCPRVDHRMEQLVQVLGGHALRSEEHTSELQSQSNLVCRLLLEKKKRSKTTMSPLRAVISATCM